MSINIKKIIRQHPHEDLKIGKGFGDARGHFLEEPGILKHNGLNVNNDPAHVRQKEEEKKRAALAGQKMGKPQK